MDVGIDNPLSMGKFYVKVLTSSSIALYKNSSLTVPVQYNPANSRTSSDTVMATWLLPKAKITLLNRLKLTYKEFPDDYIPQNWPVSWGTNQATVYDGTTLSGWTLGNIGVSSVVSLSTSEGNSAPPAFYVPYSTYAYREFEPAVTSTLIGKTITFNVKPIVGVTQLCNFFFGCDKTGAGPMLRLDCRTGYSSNTTTAVAWDEWGYPTTGTQVVAGVWHAIKIDITEASYAQWYLDGVLQETIPVTLKGNYIAIHGDYGAGAYFDDIIISGNEINSSVVTWANGSETIKWVNLL